MKTRYPSPLPDRGTIGVVAPASPVDETKLNKGISYLNSLGYRTEIGSCCYKSHYYVAGTDQERADEIMQFFKSPQIDAIICARGGYGTMRLLPLLDYEAIRNHPKLFIGFSDITALQWTLWQRSRLISISAGMVATDLAADKINDSFEENYWRLLKQGTCYYPLSHQQSRKQYISGSLLPGTLSVASKLCGTPYFPDQSDSIPLLEDVNEPSHKVEGYLLQLYHSKLFNRSTAVLTGNFTPPDKEEYEEHPSFKEIIDYVFRNFSLPVATGISYGHIDNKISLPVGAPISLYLGSESYLKTQDTIFKK